MSKYTTELRYICETYAGLTESAGLNDVDSIIAAARPKLFNFDYPIFDPAYRETLETKIIEHYYTQELGFETVGRWKLALRATMREIMPTYNALYKDGLTVINPFLPIDIEDTYTKTGESTSENDSQTNDSRNRTGSREDRHAGSNSGSVHDEGTTSGSHNSEDVTEGSITKQSALKNTRWDKFSEAPQGSVSNLESDSYLTNARKITDDGTGSHEATTNDSDVTRTATDTGETENLRTISGTDSSTDTGTSADKETGTSQTSDTGSTHTTEEYILKRVGRNGADVLDILQRLRESFVDIDQMIIADLQPLFMGLW